MAQYYQSHQKFIYKYINNPSPYFIIRLAKLQDGLIK